MTVFVPSAAPAEPDARAARGVRIRQVLSVAFAIAALSWAALYNGAPLVFSDSLMYATAALNREVPAFFTVFYSAFLVPFHAGVSLWPVVLMQAAVTLHLLALTARVVTGAPLGLPAMAGISAGLAAGSALPWLVGQVMPDLFTGVVILGVFLLAFGGRSLRAGERAYVAILTALAVAFHLSHLPIAAGMLLVCAVIQVPTGLRLRPLALAAGCLAAGAAAMLTVTFVATRQIGFARASDVFVLAKLIDEGPAMRHLRDACPQAGYRLCAVVDELERKSHDELKWSHESPLRQFGPPDALQAEARVIVRATLAAYPGAIVQRSAIDALRQLARFQTGDGLAAGYAAVVAWHVRNTFGDGPAETILASRQAQGTLPLDTIRPMHAALLGVAAALCVVFAASAGVPRLQRQFLLAIIAAVVFAGLVTGALSGPYDRYLARVAWLLPFGALLVAADRWRRLPARDPPL